MDDPISSEIEHKSRRRLRTRLFRHRKVPIRLMIPNFFTLLSLAAGLTAMRMAIEQQWFYSVALIVLAAALDGVDGRMARLLKASSRFGAELDSLADFVNFGVAPAVLLFNWALQDTRSVGWIIVMVFAMCSAMRLARFNVALEVERPKWQSNYFTGMPAPAAAIAVLLPIYLDGIGVPYARTFTPGILLYTLLIAFMMVSTIPTYSGKLLHERIPRDYVLPVFAVAVLGVSLLVTYTYPTLAALTLAYLATIPLGAMRFRQHASADAQRTALPAGTPEHAAPAVAGAPAADHTSRDDFNQTRH